MTIQEHVLLETEYVGDLVLSLADSTDDRELLTLGVGEGEAAGKDVAILYSMKVIFVTSNYQYEKRAYGWGRIFAERGPTHQAGPGCGRLRRPSKCRGHSHSCEGQ